MKYFQCNNNNSTFSLLISIRYNFDGKERFKILHPTYNNTIIGIQLFTLNIVRNIDELNLSNIDANVPGQNHVRHLIVFEQRFTTVADTKLLSIFNQFWLKQSLNAYVVYWNFTLNVVTFTPFLTPNLIFIPSYRLKDREFIFADKAKNVMGYSLKATVFYDESRAIFDKNNLDNIFALDGSDGLLGRLIVERMNATLQMSVPKDGQEIGEILPNGTFTGCFAALAYQEADIGFNMRFYRLSQFEGKMEATHANGRDDICLLVPRVGKAVNLANIFRPFELFVWLAIAISIPCYAIACYLLLIPDRNSRRSCFFYIMQLFSYTIQQV